MNTWIIAGGKPLRGEVRLTGAKNSITKLMVASMLTAQPCQFDNAPYIGDSQITQVLCEALGAQFSEPEPHRMQVRTPDLGWSTIPQELGSRNRLAIMLLGPLLHRTGEAIIPIAAGGDRIGPRPVDFHLEGYRKMGAQVEVGNEMYWVRCDRLRGADIALPFPSVTTTENLLLGATLAEGRTYIRNAAIEPEVMDLVMFLQKMGAIIDYNADRTLVIEGVKELHGARHRIIPDRIVAASLACAAVASKGDVYIADARQSDLVTFLNALRRVGGCFEVDPQGIRFFHHDLLRSIALETNVHPGFMTDWQAPFVLLLTQAEGLSVVHETVFESRFGYVKELQKMGADIALYDTCLGGTPCRFRFSNYPHSAVVRGPVKLHGAEILVPDLRAGFTYLIAALVADGRSTIRGVEHIERGYEDLGGTLRALGADIEVDL